MNRKWLFLIPMILVISGCATCNKNKMQNLETRVTTLENKEMSQTSTPSTSTEVIVPVSGASQSYAPETPTKKDIQISLKNAGYYSGSIDGKVGHKTKKAIEEFQKANDLKPDGKVGPNTWNKLKVYFSESTASSAEVK